MREQNFKTLQQQAYDYIKNMIMNQPIEYNRLYSESKLAVEMGISRTPVRDAVHRLYQEGLLDIVPNKGFTLHRLTEQDIMEIFGIRSSIEGYCAFRTAENIHTVKTQQTLQKLKASLDQQEAIFQTTKDVNAFSAEDQHFHYILISSSGNEAFQSIFDQYMYRIRKLMCYSLTHDHRMLHTLEEHRNLYQAILEGNPHKAYDAAILHMKRPMDIHMECIYE